MSSTNLPNRLRSLKMIGSDRLSSESPDVSLEEALKDSSDFIFDMSVRWKSAYLETLEDPIFPPEKEAPKRASSFVGRIMSKKPSRRDGQRLEDSQHTVQTETDCSACESVETTK